MLDFLFDYRYLIWAVGGLLTYWLVMSLPTWQRMARAGTWNAERDYATWRVRRALMALCLLVPLLVTTTLSVVR